jgi:hypothetical protein
VTDPLSELRAQRAAAIDAIGLAAGTLAAARAVGDPTDAALAALQQAQATESALRAQVSAAVAGLGSPEDGIGRLDARHPVAFLPVRLETRFVRGQVAGRPDAAGNLLVRIYPDPVLADSHEPLLTAAEVAAGQGYWRQAFRDGQERAAWATLLGSAKAERAAWIVERTTPSNVDAHDAHAEPVFPEIGTRPDNWHRAPEARALPDRWVVSAYRAGQLVHQGVSEPVREGLALTLRLSGDSDDDATVDLSGDGLTVAPQLRWAYDFAEALAAGMAVQLPMTGADIAQGFDTVLAFGLRTGEPAQQQAAQLDQLLRAHRYSRGLAFVPQGTPTNNTSGAASGYPVDDPAGAVSFPVTRGPALAGPGTDGARFATALGVPASAVDHVAGAGRDEQTGAGAMVRALWPATVGYFLGQLLAPEVSAGTVEGVRQFTADWVRPRGPLPAFRVGAVPYGVLPALAYSAWAPRAEEGVPPGLGELLGRFAAVAATRTGAAARVGASTDPDADLVAVLGMDASARTGRIRRSFGYDTTWNLFGYTGRDLSGLQQAQQRVGQQILTTLGQPGRDPRALHLSYLVAAHDFGGPMVAPAPLSESQPLAFDYLTWLAQATPATLRSQQAPPGPADSLLYLMLRHGLLAEYDVAAQRLLAVANLLLPHESRESELVGILPQRVLGRSRLPTVRTAWERFNLSTPATGARTIGEYLADPTSVGSARLADYRSALKALAGTPTAELDRLFTESLDACSHRLDPWLTALATRRLATLRAPASPPDGESPGVYLGCYGWVVDLRADPPAPTVAVTGPDGQPAHARTDSDGFIHAPSMLHGATAAVLRSGYLARSGPAQQPYAVDLSSARVRDALAVLDAVRDTQPLGAVLGYAFERGLHEGHPGVELDQFIDDFRRLYPAVANKSVDSGLSADTIAARSVVDGLALYRAAQTGQIPWAGLTTTTDQRAAIEAELARLDDAVDAVSDLLLGESVFQILKGSPTAAAATLDTLARGQRPPEPEVVTTPRGGTVVYQRVALLLGATGSGWSAVPETPRAAAAPELDAWLGSLLGDPAAIGCVATRDGGSGHRVSVADLGLHPVDLLAILQQSQISGGPQASGPQASGPQASGPQAFGGAQDELGQRIAAHQGGPVTVDYGDDGGTGISFAVALEVVAAVARLLGHSRPLRAADLSTPTGAAPSTVESADLANRATAARQALSTARQALADAGTDPASLRSALTRAADFGLPQALAATGSAPTLAAIDARLTSAEQALTAAAALAAVFGTSLPVIEPFTPDQPQALTPALAAEPELGDDPDATVESWLAQAARVQPGLDAWRDVQLYGRALDHDLPRARIAQLPAGPAPQRWAALGFASEAQRPRSGLVSLALLGAPPPAVTEQWCGVLLGEWPEIIPTVEEEAGIAVQYDAPGAQAPQAVLLAVPAGNQPAWSYPALERTLLDTLQLAEIRALELPQLGDFGQLLPMTFLAENTAGAAISTSFAGLLVGEATLEVAP